MSLRIELKHDYVITADTRCYLLYKTGGFKKDKNGKTYEVQANVTYWPTINMALKRYIRVIPIEQKEEITSLKDYMKAITHLEAEVEQLMEGY